MKHLAPALIVTLLSAGAASAQSMERIDSFDHQRVIEWGGDHVQVRLQLERQEDGSYLAAISGEDVKERVNVPVSAAEAKPVFDALRAMASFTTDSFAGHGHHWYTKIQAKGGKADGAPWSWSRFFYDADGPLPTADALEKAVAKLAKTVEGRPVARCRAHPTAARLRAQVEERLAQHRARCRGGLSRGIQQSE